MENSMENMHTDVRVWKVKTKRRRPNFRQRVSINVNLFHKTPPIAIYLSIETYPSSGGIGRQQQSAFLVGSMGGR